MGMQAGIGGIHLPCRHLEAVTLLLMWYPGSQKKWMLLFWGKPWHGDGLQRNPPCSGTRGWVQLLSRPVQTQKVAVRANLRSKGGVSLLPLWKPRPLVQSSPAPIAHTADWLTLSFLLIKKRNPSFFPLRGLRCTATHPVVLLWFWQRKKCSGGGFCCRATWSSVLRCIPVAYYKSTISSASCH